GEYEVAVDEDGDLAGGGHPQELGATMRTGREVDGDGIEGDAKLLERPAGADRSGGGEFVQGHRASVGAARGGRFWVFSLLSNDPGPFRHGGCWRPTGCSPPTTIATRGPDVRQIGDRWCPAPELGSSARPQSPRFPVRGS